MRTFGTFMVASALGAVVGLNGVGFHGSAALAKGKRKVHEDAAPAASRVASGAADRELVGERQVGAGLVDDLDRRVDMLAGATLRNPDTIDRWAETLPRNRPIVAYCIYGFQVSGNAIDELRKRGYNARSLKGGFAAWHAIGGPTIPLDQSTYEV